MMTEPGSVRLKGMAISPGLAAGSAFVPQAAIAHPSAAGDIDLREIEAEWERLERNMERVGRQLESLRDRVHREMNGHLSLVFDAHREMLADEALIEEVRREIQNELVNAAEAVRRVFRRWERRFRSMPAAVSQARADDMVDLQHRLVSSLAGLGPDWTDRIPAGSVLVVDRLLPSIAAALPGRAAVGVAAVSCSPASHAALLMREAGLPLVAQLDGLLEAIRPRDLLLLDGIAGVVAVRPDPGARTDFERQVSAHAEQVRNAQAHAVEPAVTRDGRTIQVMANVGCRDDTELAAANGADGVGLFRVEQLYLSSPLPPGEDELAKMLGDVVAPIGDKPVRIRLLDVGADKQVPYLASQTEANPALGCRGIRFLFEHPSLMQTQIRGVLRLSRQRPLSILAPMVVLRDDLLRVREMIAAEADDLGIADPPPFGIMIETPAAALCVGDWLQEVDFVSFGTNDLTQYTMAADRENAQVVRYFRDDHPAVVRLVALACQAASGVPRCICGDLASHPDAVETLLRLGVESLSVPPPVVPLIKQQIREIDFGRAAET